MENLFRPSRDLELGTMLSEDSVKDLLTAYQKNRKKLIGKHISDVALSVSNLFEWQDVDIIDRIIPFYFGRQSREPIGYRIWYLTQRKHSQYYSGCFFDTLISKSEIRTIRKRYKITDNAIKLFVEYPDIKDNKDVH